MTTVRTCLLLAAVLTLALLGWELALWWLLSGGGDADAAGLGRRLAGDAGMLWPLLTVALWLAGLRRHGGPGARAASASLAFLALLLPVAVGRSLVQQRAAQAASVRRGDAISATQPTAEGRFLCAATGAESLGTASTEASESPWQAVVGGMQDALLLQVPLFPLMWLLLRRRETAALPVHAAGRLAMWSPALLLVAAWVVGADERHASSRAPSDERVLAIAGGCTPGAPVRGYDVAAIDVDLPLNAHGDHVPNGLMYVLEEALPSVREQERRPWAERNLQPLVLRANLGECLVLRFTNRLPSSPAALRIEGLRASTVAGERGGFAPSDAVRPGQSRTLVLPLPSNADAEGAYLLHDPESGGEREERGLFGALILEPTGSVYRDVSTGEPLRGQGTPWEAIIDVPEGHGRDFREAVLLFHALGARADLRMASGGPMPVLDEMAGPFRPGSFGLNYRSEPRFERPHSETEEESPLRARTDSALPTLRSYLGEPLRLRLLAAGSAEFHVPHLPGRSERAWRELKNAPPTSPESPKLLGPGHALTLAFGEGPEPLPPEPGDFVYHCHMPNHILGGLQGHWRVSAERQEGLAPLPDRPASPAPR